MTAPIGNEFWKMRTKHGPNVLMENPAALFEACNEYFVWNAANPLTSEKVTFNKRGKVQRATVYHPRAMTIWAICTYLGIVSSTWYDWKRDRADLLPVMKWAEEIIKQQKFEAAAVGLMNANIISRELGLADKQLHEYTAPAIVMEAPEGPRPPPSPIHGE